MTMMMTSTQPRRAHLRSQGPPRVGEPLAHSFRNPHTDKRLLPAVRIRARGEAPYTSTLTRSTIQSPFACS